MHVSPREYNFLMGYTVAVSGLGAIRVPAPFVRVVHQPPDRRVPTFPYEFTGRLPGPGGQN